MSTVFTGSDEVRRLLAKHKGPSPAVGRSLRSIFHAVRSRGLQKRATRSPPGTSPMSGDLSSLAGDEGTEVLGFFRGFVLSPGIHTPHSPEIHDTKEHFDGRDDTGSAFSGRANAVQAAHTLQLVKTRRVRQSVCWSIALHDQQPWQIV